MKKKTRKKNEIYCIFQARSLVDWEFQLIEIIFYALYDRQYRKNCSPNQIV